MNLDELQSNIKLFEYYKSQGDRTFQQLEEEDLFWQYNDASNSIAIIVNHLHGNMKSRWTDFLTSDGEKEWRQRDQEFEDRIQSRSELISKWEAGWECLFAALLAIDEDNIHTKVFIRNQVHSIAEAVHRQLAHYASHVGQIVYIGRMIKGNDWQSLSIPKGQSSSFNREKFDRGKHQGHFSDDIK